jgi:hypothetical protein
MLSTLGITISENNFQLIQNSLYSEQLRKSPFAVATSFDCFALRIRDSVLLHPPITISYSGSFSVLPLILDVAMYLIKTRYFWPGLMQMDCGLLSTLGFTLHLNQLENGYFINRVLYKLFYQFNFLFKFLWYGRVVDCWLKVYHWLPVDFIVLNHWHSIPQMNMFLRSLTLSWFRANQYLFLLLNPTWFTLLML